MGKLKFPKDTVCCAFAAIVWIVCVRLIVALPAVIVRCTTTPFSWKLPESSTVAAKLRSADTFTVVAVEVDSAVAPGLATTETSADPCSPLGVPPVDAPLRLLSSTPNERALTSSEFGTKVEPGMTTPVIPCVFSCCVAGMR